MKKMTVRGLFELIEQGEGLKVEFKRKFSTFEKMAKEMIALANTKGGRILVGVDDNGKIIGIESEKEIAELIEITSREYCQPPVVYSIDFIGLKEKDIAVITVGESEFKPHRLQDYLPELNLSKARVYVRVKDKSLLAGKELIKLMQTNLQGRGLKNYEIGKCEKIAFELLEKQESITVKDLKVAANISYRRASRTLIKLTRANLLLIHKKESGEEYFTYSGD